MTSTNATKAVEAARELNASDLAYSARTADVQAGQVYIDHKTGRRMVVKGLTSGLADRSADYAIIRSEDGHPSGTGVVSTSRLKGKGYTLAASVLSLLALTAPALGADANAPATHAQPTPASIAPGGNITSVVQETAAHGWPHRVTANEAADVTNLALWYATTTANVRTRTSVRCYFGSTFRGAYCGIKYARGGRQTGAFRLNARIFEDGSYTYTRRGNR